jgi:intracellular multiplication protein IcmJ
MTLLPLVLSAASWNPSGAPDRRQFPTDSTQGNCRFCGFRATGWMEVSYVSGKPATACVLCHLCHGLDRPTIEAEATLVWLPEMSQAALIAAVRRLHIVCDRHGAAPTMDRVPRSGAESMRRAWGVHAALHRRAGVAEERLGTRLIRDLAAALAGLTDRDARVSAALLGGLRLMPLGRFYRNGIDVYPALLAATQNKHGAAA